MQRHQATTVRLAKVEMPAAIPLVNVTLIHGWVQLDQGYHGSPVGPESFYAWSHMTTGLNHSQASLIIP